ncbi:MULTISPECIES: hypothetical protein [unclassified Streptomyces]|uniref:hypothetical protein n=1 Tax=unclassified Streptomyces TaxID=2593676 RepID=UPI001180312B|nr:MULTISPECIES: hypothetical protein [unclassified Streptomyces]MYU02083.1 hypothetical protein [Streptomyces sp. SID8350]
MTSDRTRKAGSGKSQKIVKLADKPAKGKAAKQYGLPGKSADAGTRKAPSKRAGSGPLSQAGLRVPRASVTAMPAKGKPSSSGNLRQLRPQKPVHDGWGPFYDLAGVAKLLGISPAEAEKRGEVRELLMVSTPDGGLLFPAWQFTERHPHPHSRVAKALTVFRDLQTSPWLVVQWATAPNPKLADITPVQWLRGNQPLDPVIEDARAYAARWSR